MPRHEVVDEEDLLGVSPDLVYARSIELSAAGSWRSSSAACSRSPALPREAGPPPELAHLYPDVLEMIQAEDLARIAAAVLRRRRCSTSHVTPIRYTMAEAVERSEDTWTGSVGRASATSSPTATNGSRSSVRFLALLELYREGKVDLEQAETFGEIEVRWEGEAA